MSATTLPAWPCRARPMPLTRRVLRRLADGQPHSLSDLELTVSRVLHRSSQLSMLVKAGILRTEKQLAPTRTGNRQRQLQVVLSLAGPVPREWLGEDEAPVPPQLSRRPHNPSDGPRPCTRSEGCTRRRVFRDGGCVLHGGAR